MPRTSKRLVLIVEHDRYLRWILHALFVEAGFEVVCASNGVGGLRHAVELKPVLVVIGAALPELSTVELHEQLRAVHRFSRSRLVMVDEILLGTRLPSNAPSVAAIRSRGTISRSAAAVAPVRKGSPRRARKIEYDASNDVAPPQVAKDVVDVVQRGELDVRPHQSCRGELESFSQVLAIADNGSANGNTLENDIEYRRWEGARG